jgi:AraC-like DNA-binding protein
MDKLITLIDSFSSGSFVANANSPLKNLGLISCSNTIRIKHVPFYDPCIILVLSGRKVIYDADVPLICEKGSAITVPAPASIDLRNDPDKYSQQYRALVIPFKHEDLIRLRKIHDIDYLGQQDHIQVLNFRHDETFISSLTHYLESPDDPQIVRHRLIELLLILVRKNPRLMSYALNFESWKLKVSSILSADLGREWQLADICHSLATSESTLRRQLQREGTGFRDILHELRLSSALIQILQTSAPVYQIACDCGYQSVSRFTSNFRKRFGLPPTELRSSMEEKEQNLTVTEQSS